MINFTQLINRPDFPFASNKQLFLQMIQLLPRVFAKTIEKSENKESRADSILEELNEA